MKKVYSHPVGFVERWGLQLISVNLENVSKKEEPEALDQGFLLDIKKDEEIWYQCRSTRVNVSSYNTTPYKGEWAYSTNLNAFKRLYKRFITERQFYAHPGDSEVCFKRDKLIEYSVNGEVHGISKIRTYTNTFECNLFVHDDNVRNLGKKTFLHEFYLANQKDYNYVYTGPGYEKSSIYKADFKGFEWWTGNELSTDRNEFIKLCKRDSKVKTIEDLSKIWDLT